VAVAENNGKIVGCNHWLLRRFKLSDSVVVNGVLAADIVVNPEYRKKGVGRALMNFLRSHQERKNLVLMYMFANPELRKHFHTPIGGYIPAPSGTAMYTKILNWNKVKRNVAVFNEKVKRGEFRDKLAKVDLTLAFRVRGAPTLCLHVNSEGVESDASAERADVTISSDVATFGKIKSEKIGMWKLVRLMLTGKLRFKGKLRKLLTAYRNMWVFREILSGKIT